MRTPIVRRMIFLCTKCIQAKFYHDFLSNEIFEFFEALRGDGLELFSVHDLPPMPPKTSQCLQTCEMVFDRDTGLYDHHVRIAIIGCSARIVCMRFATLPLLPSHLTE